MTSKVLEITKEKVLRASEKCPQAKEVLKELFSEAFEKKGRKDITKDIDWAMYGFCSDNYWLMGAHEGKEIFYFNSTGLHFNHIDYEEDYEFEIRDENGSFRILKRV